ncbi:serine hydrolase [Sinomicrobium weinanense]|uniref:beta-lactamase n=1 Tax=Sinomicrobium weinanense TaxID=2842200 RepID=A0A926JP07_9FLAO|nr:serine hydrolase [Sinomicrobium weinanense]MBC9794835.1 serine hydrolase [Sinomicrobium weinanense]MBU3125606.1 class A beta-lactamase-related serine hydrolase [Sinomicrobium weinanense]
MKTLLPLFIFFCITTAAQQSTSIPSYYKTDNALSEKLNTIAGELELDRNFSVGEDGTEQISLAVIQLKESEQPRIGGVHMENFIYPASVYKMYVAAEVLRQVSEGKYALDSLYVVRSPNDVDTAREVLSDPRPLLHDGDTVTVNYLLDLMISRSDNSAANCLIDLARRKNINALMHQYHWQGSEVTRKFLKREFEDPGYKDIRGTETSALHAADFFYRIATDRLVNPWVSMQLKTLLGRQLDNTKLSQGLPHNTMFYHKTGWWSYWTHDAGIVKDGKVHYILACFLPLKEEQALPKFRLLAEKVDALMRKD